MIKPFTLLITLCGGCSTPSNFPRKINVGLLHLLHNMHGKEFIIKPKSAIKKDKAIAQASRLLVQVEEIKERQKLLQSQMTRMTRELSRLNKIIKDNT